MSFNTGFILDFVILVLLGITILYAARLSFFMRTFQEGRRDLIKLIEALSKNIEQAERSIQGMHNAAASSGASLQDVIKEAKFLSDELQFMNQSGDALAGRLEKLAERNRELVDLLESSGGIGVSEPYVRERRAPSTSFHEREVSREKEPDPFFKIQDREFEESEHGLADGIDSSESFSDLGDFKSEAEKEFYEALQKRGKKRAQVKSRAGGVS